MNIFSDKLLSLLIGYSNKTNSVMKETVIERSWKKSNALLTISVEVKTIWRGLRRGQWIYFHKSININVF